MDPKSFYGLSTECIPKIPNDGNESDDSDMSDETASTSRKTIYASDSENERDNGEKVHAGIEPSAVGYPCREAIFPSPFPPSFLFSAIVW
jgi:hypothetical protein